MCVQCDNNVHTNTANPVATLLGLCVHYVATKFTVVYDFSGVQCVHTVATVFQPPHKQGVPAMNQQYKNRIVFRTSESDYDLIATLAKDSHLPIGTFMKQLARKEAHARGLRSMPDQPTTQSSTPPPATTLVYRPPYAGTPVEDFLDDDFPPAGEQIDSTGDLIFHDGKGGFYTIEPEEPEVRYPCTRDGEIIST
jgi:hypothetical protein